MVTALTKTLGRERTLVRVFYWLAYIEKPANFSAGLSTDAI